jgi:hypothetical protein
MTWCRKLSDRLNLARNKSTPVGVLPAGKLFHKIFLIDGSSEFVAGKNYEGNRIKRGYESWNSTLEYCRLINKLVASRLGGLHSADIVLYSLDFGEIERAQRESRWDGAAVILVKAGAVLKQAGAG